MHYFLFDSGSKEKDEGYMSFIDKINSCDKVLIFNFQNDFGVIRKFKKRMISIYFYIHSKHIQKNQFSKLFTK